MTRPPGPPRRRPSRRRHVDDRLHDYLDGRLAGEGSRRVEQHLLACGACRGRLEQEQQLRSRLRAAGSAEPRDPAGLVAGLLSLAQEGGDPVAGRPAPTSRASRSPRRPLTWTAVVLVCGAGAGVLAVQHRPPAAGTAHPSVAAVRPEPGGRPTRPPTVLSLHPGAPGLPVVRLTGGIVPGAQSWQVPRPGRPGRFGPGRAAW